MAGPNGNGQNVPILGGKKPMIGAGLGALPRKLDENGMFEGAKAVQTPAGIVGVPHRSDFVDATELVEMLRVMVREELQKALKGETT